MHCSKWMMIFKFLDSIFIWLIVGISLSVYCMLHQSLCNTQSFSNAPSHGCHHLLLHPLLCKVPSIVAISLSIFAQCTSNNYQKYQPSLHNALSIAAQSTTLIIVQAPSIVVVSAINCHQCNIHGCNAWLMVCHAWSIVVQCLVNPCTILSQLLHCTWLIVTQYLVGCCTAILGQLLRNIRSIATKYLVDHCTILGPLLHNNHLQYSVDHCAILSPLLHNAWLMVVSCSVNSCVQFLIDCCKVLDQLSCNT